MFLSATSRNLQKNTMPSLRIEDESIDEIKHKLICTKFELIAARMDANTEIRKYEETIKRLFQLLKRVCQERDEARDQLQLLQRRFQPSTPSETSRTTPQIHPQRPVLPKMKPSKESNMILSLASSCQSDDGRSSKKFSDTKIAESSGLPLTKKIKTDIGRPRDIIVDSASVMIDEQVWGKANLPGKGRLLRAVTEAGPLFDTLVGPRRHIPPPLSPNHGRDDNNSSKVDDKAGVIPTSLSLAFPGNSRGPCHGLSVKNEPMPYEDMDSNMFIAKKRKLL